MRDRGTEGIGRSERVGASPATERLLVLVGAGVLLVAVGLFGYVLGDVPASTTQTLLPLQLVGPRAFGWILTAVGVAVLLMSAQPSTVRLGFGLAVGAFAVMGAWFLVGWFADAGGDTRPLASAALYLFLTGALLVQARAPVRPHR